MTVIMIILIIGNCLIIHYHPEHTLFNNRMLRNFVKTEPSSTLYKLCLQKCIQQGMHSLGTMM